MAVTPNILIKITGNGNVNYSERNISWTPKEQIESKISIVDTDPKYKIDLTGIENKKIIVISSDDNFVLDFIDGSDAVLYSLTDIKMYMIEVDNEGNYDNMFLSTNSVTHIVIDFRIYGE